MAFILRKQIFTKFSNYSCKIIPVKSGKPKLNEIALLCSTHNSTQKQEAQDFNKLSTY